jgi:peptidoglycan L-alanyl-D-glutamate endopeptidase CwlK
MQKNEVQQINRDVSKLAPFLVIKLTAALDECHEKGYNVAVFEGYRSPERQQSLYDQGRTAPGRIVTYAKPWESFHQLGLAVDIVGKTNGKWDWSIDYDKITEIFKRHGFKPLKFEKAHFQIDGGLTISKAVKIAKTQGILALWSIVEQSMK